MPVIRGPSGAAGLAPDRRKSLLDQLAGELQGKTTANAPLVFEIPLKEREDFDVLVVWAAWDGVRSDDRTNLILEAYQQARPEVAQRVTQVAEALGVTCEEAIRQQLLPYAVVPMSRQDDENPDAIREAMLAQGGMRLASGKVELRFPTMAMAEEAHRRLCEKLPRGYWSIVQTVAPVP